jgi:diguanylate cyclase (GGDEF)-like protein
MSAHETTMPNILIVDDTRDNLRLLGGILSKQGYSVRPVPDGTLALLSAQEAPPDLILLDIMMPNMNGYDVCEKLKADDRTRDIPIIFISALHEVFDKVRAFELGGVDFITKPFQVEEVVARVETHLNLRNLNKELQGKNAQLQQEIGERMRAEESLKESVVQIERAKIEWESTADSLSYVVCLLDNQGRILRANRTVELWDLGQVIDIKGQRMHDLFHPDCTDPTCYLKTFLSQAWEEIAQGRSAEREARDPILQRYLSVQVRPITAQMDRELKQSVSFAVGCVHDITERKQAEKALRQRNRELALLNQMGNFLQECRAEEETYSVFVSVCKELFPSDSGGLYMTDDSQPLFRMVASWGSAPPKSQAFDPDECWALHYDKPLLVKTPEPEPLCPHLCSPPDNGYLCIPIETLDRTLGVFHLCFGPCEICHSDDEYRHLLELKRVVVTRVIEQYALSLANLRLRETLRIESIRDPLTNLYNRRYMEESLEREARRTKRNHTFIGIMMIDIDHFKLFNDTHGHKAGDVVLRELGTLLQESIRGGDIACRYGGEEFLLILPDTTLEIAQKRAEQLLLQVRDLKIPYQDENFHITVSIGVSVLSEHSPGVQEIITEADEALYQAKEGGRNQVVVASSSP